MPDDPVDYQHPGKVEIDFTDSIPKVKLKDGWNPKFALEETKKRKLALLSGSINIEAFNYYP